MITPGIYQQICQLGRTITLATAVSASDIQIEIAHQTLKQPPCQRRRICHFVKCFKFKTQRTMSFAKKGSPSQDNVIVVPSSKVSFLSRCGFLGATSREQFSPISDGSFLTENSQSCGSRWPQYFCKFIPGDHLPLPFFFSKQKNFRNSFHMTVTWDQRWHPTSKECGVHFILSQISVRTSAKHERCIHAVSLQTSCCTFVNWTGCLHLHARHIWLRLCGQLWSHAWYTLAVAHENEGKLTNSDGPVNSQ